MAGARSRNRSQARPSPYLRPPTVTPTTVRSPLAGVAQSNVIPAAAEATLDIRLTSGPDESAISAEIDRFCREAAARTAGVTVDWRPINGYRLAPRGGRKEPPVQAIAAAVEEGTAR